MRAHGQQSPDRVGCRGLRPGTLPHHRTCGFPHTAIGSYGILPSPSRGLNDQLACSADTSYRSNGRPSTMIPKGASAAIDATARLRTEGNRSLEIGCFRTLPPERRIHAAVGCGMSSLPHECGVPAHGSSELGGSARVRPPWSGSAYALHNIVPKVIYKADDTRAGFVTAMLSPVHSSPEPRFGVRQALWIVTLTFGAIVLALLLLAK